MWPLFWSPTAFFIRRTEFLLLNTSQGPGIMLSVFTYYLMYISTMTLTWFYFCLFTFLSDLPTTSFLGKSLGHLYSSCIISCNPLKLYELSGKLLLSLCYIWGNKLTKVTPLGQPYTTGKQQSQDAGTSPPSPKARVLPPHHTEQGEGLGANGGPDRRENEGCFLLVPSATCILSNQEPPSSLG